MTAEAFVCAGPQRAGRGVARGEQRHIRGELVARDAVESRLPRHLAEPDLDRAVAARLPAGRVHGHEAMDLEPVTRRALHVAQCTGIRFEVDAMAGRLGDPFPLVFLFVPLHVTTRAHRRRYLRMHLDLFRPVGDPEIELASAREDRLLVTVMAAE